MRKTRWGHLLDEDPVFRRWYDNLARGSEGTARERARVLYRFLGRHGLTPSGLAEMGKEDVGKVEDLLMDFVTELHRDGRAPGYIDHYLAVVKSWLGFNGVRLVRRIKIRNRGSTPTLEDERIPTPDELRQVLGYADGRGRCSVAFMAFAGLRPMTLGNMTGTDGLEVRDLPEMRIEGGRVTFSKIPTMVVVRPSLSKAKHRYFTFLASEGCDCLNAYLEKRLALGEELGRDSAIIAVKQGHEVSGFRNLGDQDSGHIVTKTVTNGIRSAMRPRFNWRPYVLRAYFDTQLLIAENHGKISHAYRQFFMGHKGDIEARYTVNKGLLPEALIEDMRRRFTDSDEYLSTRKDRGEDPKIAFTKMLIKTGNIDLNDPEVRSIILEEINIADRKNRIARAMSENDLERGEAEKQIILEEVGIDPTEIRYIRPKKAKNTKKIISEDQLEEYLNDGWDIDSNTPSGSIVVRKVTYV